MKLNLLLGCCAIFFFFFLSPWTDFIFLLLWVDQCTHDCFISIIYYNQNHCLFFPACFNELFLEVFRKRKHKNAYISNVYFKVCAVAGR